MLSLPTSTSDRGNHINSPKGIVTRYCTRYQGGCRLWGCDLVALGNRALAAARTESRPGQRSAVAVVLARRLVAFSVGSLRQDLVDDISVYVGQSSFNPVVIERQPGVLDSQQVQHRGVKVGPRNGVDH